VAARPWPAKPLPAWREGQRSLFLSRIGVRARVVAWRPGQPGGRPSHWARARVRPGESAPAVWGKKMRRGKEGWLTGWPHRSARENKRKRDTGELGRGVARSIGPMKLDGPTGRLRKLPAQQAVKALD
jgi:hypothetical protein